MKVRAKRLGYYQDKRRREGEIFELQAKVGYKKLKDGKVEEIDLSAESFYSENWMEPVEGKAPVKKEVRKVEPEVKEEVVVEEDVL